MAWPAEQITEEALERLQSAFAVSSRRTPLQDTRFLVDELVEVGTRALSPGVNDPFTAISCLDWLGAALSEAARRKLPSPYRVDDQRNLRLIAQPLTFAGYVERALGQFRQYLATDKNACLHSFRTIERVAEACANDDQLTALREELRSLRAAAKSALDAPLFQPVDLAGEATDKRIAAALGRS